MNKFQMGVVGRRVCIKCEFYRNVDSKIIGTHLIEGREQKLFYGGGSKAGKKKIYSEGVQSREQKIFSGDAGGEGESHKNEKIS